MTAHTPIDLADSRPAALSATDTPGKLHPIWIVLPLMLIAALATGLYYWSDQVGEETAALEQAAMAETSRVAALDELTEGEQAEIVIEGASAQERNDQIPLSGLPIENAAAFSAITAASPQYGSAHKCLTQAIYYEAANESVAGKRAVAQVVLNRLRHPAYPASVCGVVYEGVNRPVCQFSFTCDGSLLRKPMARQWNESRQVAAAALAGSTEKSVGTSTHYHADYVVPRWAFTLAKVEKIGRHIFYRFPGRGGKTAAFTSRWTGREAVPSLSVAALTAMLDDEGELDIPVEPEYVEGLTVTPLVSDRHAATDVGGRLDTTREWRLKIPDPVEASSGYRQSLEQQRAAAATPREGE
ncbi:cell wall hydrolase [Altererythrobacter aquiaggeris]|uniref:cell wall hydrolase n=1 Tax=Aestuarierythrobacter aquiaggeris TaxID=1898396 RepID=UPI003019F64C